MTRAIANETADPDCTLLRELRRLAHQHGWDAVEWRFEAVLKILRGVGIDDYRVRRIMEQFAVLRVLDDAEAPRPTAAVVELRPKPMVKDTDPAALSN